jgi:endonuclease/exonuclease/phosphatase family protein
MKRPLPRQTARAVSVPEPQQPVGGRALPRQLTRAASVMRIATWNVNSLKARLEKVSWCLERARPDVLLMQETKLADADAPVAAFRDAGYKLVHHGEARIAARGTRLAFPNSSGQGS